MVSKLQPGQYQIGELPFGAGTIYDVTTFDPQPYNTNNQDAQVNRSDETQFGFDTLQGQPIQIELQVKDFHVLERMIPYTGFNIVSPDFDTRGRDAAEAFAAEWNAQNTRRQFAAIQPLKICGRDGTTRVAYGRPRKIHIGKQTRRSTTIPIQCEFARSDVLYYNDDETVVPIINGATPQKIYRGSGQADAWCRIGLTGPMTHPIITIGDVSIELDIELEAGDFAEVSSYPWQRRIIDNNGLNLNAKLVGETQYLDQLKIPAGIEIPVRWTSEELNTWVPVMEDQSWVEKISTADTFRLPAGFTRIHGNPVVRLDVFNPTLLYPHNIFDPRTWARFFIGAGIFNDRSACIYNHTKFGTAYQHMEARIVEPFNGKSGIAIMSDPAMTNFALLVASSGIGQNKLRIYSGSAYNTLTAQSSVWTNPNPFGWQETDVLAFEYDPDTTTYTAFVNGDAKVTWDDSGGVVTTGSTKRSTGFIFDIDGNLLTTGMGFSNIVCYDYLTELTDVGQVTLGYRDSYYSLP